MRVAIVTASTGHGHLAASRALAEAVRAREAGGGDAGAVLEALREPLRLAWGAAPSAAGPAPRWAPAAAMALRAGGRRA